MDIILTNLSNILLTLLTTLIGYISIIIKKKFEYIELTKEKEKIIKNVCITINQLYNNITNEEKYNKAFLYIKDIFKEKGIESSELEIQILIESTVHNIKTGLTL